MSELTAEKIDEIINIWDSLLKDQVFYIPTIGNIYSSEGSVKKLLRDVLGNSKNDYFLPYDKNKRWHKSKKEKILLSSIVIDGNSLCVPVESSFKYRTLKIFYYTVNELDSSGINKIKNIIKSLKNVKKFDNCFLYCFKKPKIKLKFTCHNIYLKIITKKECLAELPKSIDYYSNLTHKVRQTFNYLGQEPELKGFNFLWKEFISKNKQLSSIICAVEKEKIIGAIGPIDISKDPWSVSWLLPPYFGVKKELRKKGYGEKLWKVAMSLAYQKGAKYTLVQNLSDSPADRFYKKQGLVKASKIYSILLK